MFKALIIVAASLTGAQAAGSGLRHHQLESVNKGFNLDRHPLYSSIAKEAKKAEVGAAVEASFVEASSGWGHWNPWYVKKQLEAAVARRAARRANWVKRRKAVKAKNYNIYCKNKDSREWGRYCSMYFTGCQWNSNCPRI